MIRAIRYALLRSGERNRAFHRLRALVVGADGLIGAALARELRQRGAEVTGTSRRPRSTDPGGPIRLDLADVSASSRIPDLPDFDVAIICAAMTGFAECRTSPSLAYRVNVEAPRILASYLIDRGVRVVFVSTAAVFDCLAPRMRADRIRAPRSVYGRLKAQAEEKLLALGDRVAVLRLTKVLTLDTSPFQDWIAAWRSGKTADAFDDHRIAPITVHHAVAALAALAVGHEGGVYQLSGQRDVSYAELAEEFAAALNMPVALVNRCSALTRGVRAEDLTPFTSLDGGRLADLIDFTPPDAFQLIHDLCRERRS